MVYSGKPIKKIGWFGGTPPILGNLQMQIITEMRPEMFPIFFRLTGFMAFGADGKSSRVLL